MEDTNVNDQPESDQHIHFPVSHKQGLMDNDILPEHTMGSGQSLDYLEDNLSLDSLESDVFYSALAFSESSSPLGFENQNTDQLSPLVEDWKSCPELDKARFRSFSDLSWHELLDLSLTENMKNNFSKSALTLKVTITYRKLQKNSCLSNVHYSG